MKPQMGNHPAPVPVSDNGTQHSLRTRKLDRATASLAQIAVICSCFVLCSCNNMGTSDLSTSVMSMELSSPAFKEGETIPKTYTKDGQDVSPPLEWSTPPSATKSLALICEDPDAPSGTFTHWLVFKVPAEAQKLDEKLQPEPTLSDGSAQGTNDFKRIGYSGPAPPAGKPHHYVFTLYALDDNPSIKAGATKDQLMAAMKGHILDRGRLTGTYER